MTVLLNVIAPVFGIGLKYQRYLTNNWMVGVILEHRIFDPESTRPLNADVDIDAFELVSGQTFEGDFEEPTARIRRNLQL